MGRKRRPISIHVPVLPELDTLTEEDWLNNPEMCFAALERSQQPPPTGQIQPLKCGDCEGTNFIYNYEKDYVCTRCGRVTGEDPGMEKHVATPEYWAMQSNRPRLINNYRTAYQLHQIFRRYSLSQKSVDDHAIYEIFEAMKLCPATWARLQRDEILTKKDVYDACKTAGHANLQKKWIDIRRQLQGIAPLAIPGHVQDYIRTAMPKMETAFHNNRKKFTAGGKQRKIFIKITYVVRRMLMALGHWHDDLEEYFPAPPTTKTRMRYDVIYNTIARATGVPLGPGVFAAKNVQPSVKQ